MRAASAGDNWRHIKGFEKVDRSYFSGSQGAASTIMAVIDPFYPRVYWALDRQGTGILSEMLVYDWGLERWSMIEGDFLTLIPIINAGMTLDGLDAISSSLDALAHSLDSRIWGAGAPILGAFAKDYRLGAFSGSAMAARVSSAEMGSLEGSCQVLTSIYPLVDSNKAQLAVGTRLRRHQGEVIRWRGSKKPSAQTGRVALRARGRFHKIQLSLPAGDNWRHIKGFEIEMKPAGWR